MPQFPEEYVTNGWVESTVLGTDKLLVNNNAVAASDLAAYVASVVAGTPETTQTVTASPATVSARVVVLDDDGHTAMSPGTLVMPPITPGAVHLIVTPYENVHYEIVRNPDDPLYTGPDYDVDSSIARQQVITLVAAESEGVLRWQYDSTGYYINTLFVALMAIGARMDDAEADILDLQTAGRQVITTPTATILPSTRVVYIDHAAARTDLTLPATPFEPFTIVKRATTGGFGVRLIPDDAVDAIQGLAAGTNFDIGWMTTNASTTAARPAAFVSSSAVNVVDVA